MQVKQRLPELPIIEILRSIKTKKGKGKKEREEREENEVQAVRFKKRGQIIRKKSTKMHTLTLNKLASSLGE